MMSFIRITDEEIDSFFTFVLRLVAFFKIPFHSSLLFYMRADILEHQTENFKSDLCSGGGRNCVDLSSLFTNNLFRKLNDEEKKVISIVFGYE